MADTTLDKQLKLSGALPGEMKDNGIDYLAPRVTADPEGTLILAIAVLDTRSITHDVPSGVDVPMMRIREIEAVALDDAGDLSERMRELRSARLGQADLFDEDQALEDHLDDDRGATVAVVPGDEDGVVRFSRGGRR